MPEEKRPMRLGEWFMRNRSAYETVVEFERTELQQGGYEQVIKFVKQRMSVITTDALVRMLQDYDKHVDDNIVL